jgi:hypothetical protein
MCEMEKKGSKTLRKNSHWIWFIKIVLISSNLRHFYDEVGEIILNNSIRVKADIVVVKLYANDIFIFSSRVSSTFLEEKLVGHSMLNPDLQSSSNSIIITNIFRDPSKAI